MTGRRWSVPDYLLAAAHAAVLIAPAPFFWAPPFWVVLLMGRAPSWSAGIGDAPPARVANDNRQGRSAPWPWAPVRDLKSPGGMPDRKSRDALAGPEARNGKSGLEEADVRTAPGRVPANGPSSIVGRRAAPHCAST